MEEHFVGTIKFMDSLDIFVFFNLYWLEFFSFSCVFHFLNNFDWNQPNRMMKSSHILWQIVSVKVFLIVAEFLNMRFKSQN